MAATEAREYTVHGMSCGGCKASVTNVVSQLPGIQDVAVDLDSLRLTVRGEAVDDSAIRSAVTGAGYEITPVP